MKIPRVAALLAAFVIAAVGSAAEWRPLFNGRDLTGWETWLGVPNVAGDVPGLARDAEGKYTVPVGLNRDPLKVFTIVQVDGQPAIRISGEITGALTTKQDLGNYRLRVVYKWGEKKWNPSPTARRNSGIIYHGHGEHGMGARSFLVGHEFQMAEGSNGDYITIGAVGAHARARSTGQSQFTYDPAADLLPFETASPHGRRVQKAVQGEKPAGEWNTLELVCFADRAAHIVNGQVTVRLSNSRRLTEGKNTPLKSGRVQIQSEGSELFVRSIEVQALTDAPAEVE